MIRTRSALISVSRKTGIESLAKDLVDLGWSLMGSSGTARHLSERGVPTESLDALTGIPPILGHRVFSEHIAIAGALVAEATGEHDREREAHAIPWFDLVCVDLYPLHEVIASGPPEREVLDSTDIGGITLIRNAVKGRRIVLVDAADRPAVIERLREQGDLPEEMRRRLWAKAELACARYILESARYISGGAVDGRGGVRTIDLRYGENPYQADAAYFSCEDDDPLALDLFHGHGAAIPGFVNLTSLDSLVDVVNRLNGAFARLHQGRVPRLAVGSKHGHVIGGCADWESAERAASGMLWSAPKAIWGGEVVVNFPVTEEVARTLISDPDRACREGSASWMLDLVAAPSFTEGALALLTRRSERKLFSCLALAQPQPLPKVAFRSLRGGFIRQPAADYLLDLGAVDWVGGVLEGVALDSLLLAWGVAWSTHANAVALAAGRQLLASDGQPSSVGAVRSCIEMRRAAGHASREFVFAANAFLPFTDSCELLAAAGARGGILPRGGVREDEVRAFLARAGMSVAFLPAEYRGFARH